MAHTLLPRLWEHSRNLPWRQTGRLATPALLPLQDKTQATLHLLQQSRLTAQVHPRGGTTSLDLARLRMRKEGCRPDGKGEKTTLAERTTSTTTQDRPRGLGRLRISMPENRGRKWTSSNRQKERDIRLVCYRRTGPERVRLRCLISGTRLLNHHLLRMHPALRRWLPLGQLQPGPESFRLVGSNGTLQKAAHTLWTTILVQLPGWIQGDSNTSGCTVRMLELETAPSSNSLCRSSVRCPAVGRCVSQTPRAYTSSIITRRLRLGTILDYLLRWIRTCHSISVTLGES